MGIFFARTFWHIFFGILLSEDLWKLWVNHGLSFCGRFFSLWGISTNSSRNSIQDFVVKSLLWAYQEKPPCFWKKWMHKWGEQTLNLCNHFFAMMRIFLVCVRYLGWGHYSYTHIIYLDQLAHQGWITFNVRTVVTFGAELSRICRRPFWRNCRRMNSKIPSRWGSGCRRERFRPV